LLREDSNLDADYWNPELNAEVWGTFVGPLEIGIDEIALGSLQFQTSDAHARFNLNNLVQFDRLDTVAKEQLVNLINTLKNKPEFRQLPLDPVLVDNIIDYIDSDTVPHQSGAEDGSYTSLETPYRPANNYLMSLSELRSVFGVDADTYAVLKDYVTVLPPGWCGGASGNTTTAINLNSAEAEIIQALGTGANPITPGDAESWVSQRNSTPFENISEVTGLPQDVIGGGYADVKSQCFEVRVQVNIGSSVMSMYSLLDRSGPNGEIITRVRTFDIE
jgi:type II secretory pathway component PulK